MLSFDSFDGFYVSCFNKIINQEIVEMFPGGVNSSFEVWFFDKTFMLSFDVDLSF